MKKPLPIVYTSYNRWFLVPFLLWVIVGGAALLMFDKEILFATFNTHHTGIVDWLMVYITQFGEGVIGTFILLVLLFFKSFRNWWYVTAAVLCNVIPAILVQIIKSGVNAPRPLQVFQNAEWIHHMPEWEALMQRSFPSGHSGAAFCLFCFLSIILRPGYKFWGLLFFLLALAVAYSRMYLAAHFFLDVYAGSVIGVFFTLLIIYIMRRHPSAFMRPRRNPEK